MGTEHEKPLYLHPPRPADVNSAQSVSLKDVHETDFGKKDDAEEPIGYIFQYINGVLGSDIYYTPEEAIAYTEGDGIGIPVYRHPPKPAELAARKPMTDEQVMKIFTEAMTQICDVGFTEFQLILAKAYERFHGIGGVWVDSDQHSDTRLDELL